MLETSLGGQLEEAGLVDIFSELDLLNSWNYGRGTVVILGEGEVKIGVEMFDEQIGTEDDNLFLLILLFRVNLIIFLLEFEFAFDCLFGGEVKLCVDKTG